MFVATILRAIDVLSIVGVERDAKHCFVRRPMGKRLSRVFTRDQTASREKSEVKLDRTGDHYRDTQLARVFHAATHREPPAGPRRRAARRPPLRGRSRTRGGSLLDNLICAQHQRRRDREAESPRSLEVDDELELRRLLDGKVRGLRALQNSINIAGSSFAALPDI